MKVEQKCGIISRTMLNDAAISLTLEAGDMVRTAFRAPGQFVHIDIPLTLERQLELLDRPMLAWHLSGGTTELLLVRPQGTNVAAEKLGGTSDISAGQLIDRTGVLLGLQFPAGKALDELYPQADACMEYRVKLKDLTFSLSGMENQVKRLLTEGEAPANVARFTLDTVCSVVLRATQEAQRRCPGLPVLCSGGVASNRQLRAAMERSCGALFAQPCYSTDNAMGVAILTRRALEGGELA